VTEAICPPGEADGVEVVAMAVGEFPGEQVITERQSLKDHRMITVPHGLEIEEESGRTGGFINKTAPHAESKIEDWFTH